MAPTHLAALVVLSAGVALAQPQASREAEAGSRSTVDRGSVEVSQRLADLGIERIADIPYDSIEGVDPLRLSLDVYTREGLDRAPVVVYVHGGAWLGGDKEMVLDKPAALVPAGYLVVAVNYRFRPQVSVPEMVEDVARATAWVRARAVDYGGDPRRIFLLGHSAGAHLVSVLGTNERFLAEVGMDLGDIRGVVSLDTGPYNVFLELELAEVPPFYPQLMSFVFCDDPSLQRQCSPWHHVETGKSMPAFLVFYCEGRVDAPYQALPFVERLQRAGVDAQAIEAKGKTHCTLDTDIGRSGDLTTVTILDFLDRLSAPRDN